MALKWHIKKNLNENLFINDYFFNILLLEKHYTMINI
jgi:hypothetical protein